MSLSSEKYAGALQCFQTALQVSQDAVDDDQEEELESYDSAINIDEKLALEDSSETALINNLENISLPITPRFQNLSIDTEDTVAGVGDSSKGASTVPTKRKADHKTMFNALKLASKNVVGNSTLQLYVR